ncbi:hypothetical protein BAnh1_11200 [Bartonella australis AUST/NH1]|uniref:Uncharacterized protein n=1 Tax=Bartonella australis (strain Aust/NH1) TaxID=1094489 RepID=M1NUR3_BARAA|nr:hypothetical protein [Bartonella australis]AGF74988.1 hypothetical protein BAnh1_11200 [Bartonella australis AUST/NH1]
MNIRSFLSCTFICVLALTAQASGRVVTTGPAPTVAVVSATETDSYFSKQWSSYSHMVSSISSGTSSETSDPSASAITGGPLVVVTARGAISAISKFIGAMIGVGIEVLLTYLLII